MADANLKIDTTLLDGLIVGRVEPHISMPSQPKRFPTI